MQRYYVDPTKSSPRVDFQPDIHKLVIQGQSYPENAFKFYEPVLAWIDEYLLQMQDDAEVTVQLEIPYINTSSTKCFMMVLERLESAHQSGKQVRIEWYYDEDNESELECAEEFKEDLTLPFELIAKPE